jgi:ABC-2 type transport system permease protein
MNAFKAVFKRELKSYFATPIAYVFLVVFLFFAGYWPFRQGFFEMRQADLQLFFSKLPLFLGVMASCVAMRLWAEERKSGSIELLLSLPITVSKAVLGKFFAAWLFMLIALLMTITMPLTAAYLGSPDIGSIIAGYLGALLMAGVFLAVGCFFSAMTRNQVISFILSVAVLAVLVYASMPTTLNYLSGFLPASMVAIAESMSILAHFEPMQKGLIQLTDIIYFILMITGWLIGCIVVLDYRKAA